MTQRVSVYFGMERKSEYVNDLLHDTVSQPGPKKGFHVVPDGVAILTVHIKNSDDPAEGNTLLHRHGVRVEETDNLVETFILPSGALQRTYVIVCRYDHSAGSTVATFHALLIGTDPITDDDTVINIVIVPPLHVGILTSDDVAGLPRQTFKQIDPVYPVFGVDHPVSQVAGDEAVEQCIYCDFTNTYNFAAGALGASKGASWIDGVTTALQFGFRWPDYLGTEKIARQPDSVYLKVLLNNQVVGVGPGMDINLIGWLLSAADGEAFNLQAFDVVRTIVDNGLFHSNYLTIPLTGALATVVRAGEVVSGFIGRQGGHASDTWSGNASAYGVGIFFPVSRVGKLYT